MLSASSTAVLLRVGLHPAVERAPSGWLPLRLPLASCRGMRRSSSADKEGSDEQGSGLDFVKAFEAFQSGLESSVEKCVIRAGKLMKEPEDEEEEEMLRSIDVPREVLQPRVVVQQHAGAGHPRQRRQRH